MDGLLSNVIAIQTVFQVHHTARAAGHDVLCLGVGNLCDFFIVDTAANIIMEQAETATESTAGIRFLHFLQFNAHLVQ